MIADTQSISIIWFAIIGVPCAAGYWMGCWHQRNENQEEANRVRRMYRRERELCDQLADEVFFAGRSESEAFKRYLKKRGR